MKPTLKRTITVLFAALACITLAIAMNWLANSGERRIKNNLEAAGYTIIATYCQGFGCHYVFSVGDCEFHAAHGGAWSDNMEVYRGAKSNKKDSGTIFVYTGNTETVGKAITGYTPESFVNSKQYRRCVDEIATPE